MVEEEALIVSPRLERLWGTLEGGSYPSRHTDMITTSNLATTNQAITTLFIILR